MSNVATRRPAETVTSLLAIVAAVLTFIGVDQETIDALVALVVLLIGQVPMIVTGIVEALRRSA